MTIQIKLKNLETAFIRAHKASKSQETVEQQRVYQNAQRHLENAITAYLCSVRGLRQKGYRLMVYNVNKAHQTPSN